jgi:hypothetical protein
MVKCPHGKPKSRCVDCGGSCICEHGKEKHQCRECKGSKFCVHDKQKQTCRLCGGTLICEHGIQRPRCSACTTTEQKLNSKYWCIVCLDTLLSKNRRRSGVKLCNACDQTCPQRIEKVIRPLLIEEVGFEPFAKDDLVFGGSDCIGSTSEKRARPDLAWAETGVVVIVEIDEDGGHPLRPSECELGRMWTLTSSFKQLLSEDTRIIFIRMNPDECDGGRFTLDERIRVVGSRVREILTFKDERRDFSSSVPRAEYYYYHSNSKHQILAALAKPDAITVKIHESCKI